MEMKFTFFILLYNFTSALELKNIVITIISQENSYHQNLAESNKNNIYEQATLLNKERPTVCLTHKDFPHVGAWTIVPILLSLHNVYRNHSWFLFMEDRTRIVLKNLIETLQKYNVNEEIWLGQALYDNEATIIHHFAFSQDPVKFKYPNLASGFALSSALLQKLIIYLKSWKPNNDFSIDGMYELALFIWNNGKGIALKHDESFCLKEMKNCSTYPEHFVSCEKPAPIHNLYFAVKTCGKFHHTRVPIVKKTWGQHAANIYFYSDKEDLNIPTINLGIPNTETGHCEKTMTILKQIVKQLNKFPKVKWIILVDDDTILSVSRLNQLLACYDSNDPIMLGERYGFNVYNEEGYNYITGGGGIVFSKTVLELVSSSNYCKCPSLTTPDDMFLGICLTRLQIPVTHSPFFHQARPDDYATGFLESQKPVSFHKHWMVDPVFVYTNWLLDTTEHNHSSHNEL